LQRRRTISPHDSVGANLVAQVKHNTVMRVLPRENEAVNECWISDKERFSYTALSSPERLTKPMIKQGGQWQEVEWNVALDYVAHGLKDIAAQSGADEIAALAAPHSTLEELALLQKLLRGLGSENVDCRLRQQDFSTDGQQAGAAWLGLRIAELGDLDAALVVGSFLRKDHPLLAQRLRQAAQKDHAAISLISVSADDPLLPLHVRQTVAPSELAFPLAAVLKAAAAQKGVSVAGVEGLEQVDVTAEAEAIARSLLAGEKTAILLGNAARQSAQAGLLHGLAQKLAELTGAKFGFLGEAANSVGWQLLRGSAKGANARQLLEQPRQAYLLFGIEPELDCANPQLALAALKQARMVALFSAFKHAPALEYADVLLPLTPFTETSGTYVNTEGRAQSFVGVTHPAGEARPGWKILRVLGNALNLPGFDYESSEAVRDEVLKTVDGFVVGLDNGFNDETQVVLPMTRQDESVLERIADVPIHFTDPLARRAAPLQKTADAAPPTARMSAATLAKLGVTAGEGVTVRQGEGVARLTAVLDDGVPAGCVRIAAAHAATASLGEMFGTINVERA
jgi:NADH-quinone oxidoreductase subunit G